MKYRSNDTANSGCMLREVAAEIGVEETHNKAMDQRKMAQGCV